MYNYIRKFKNGKVKLSIPKNDYYYRDLYGEVVEEFYHDEMYFNNLYIDVIEGDWYIIDTSNGLVYDYFTYLVHNPLKELLNDLTDNETLYLYPELNSKELYQLYIKEHSE